MALAAPPGVSTRPGRSAPWVPGKSRDFLSCPSRAEGIAVTPMTKMDRGLSEAPTAHFGASADERME